jgi:predicted nucleic acid-binding protein
MIYLDTSVLLARLFAEDRFPPDAFWEQPLVSSRLIEYEAWTRIHGRNVAKTHGEAARLLLARVALVELLPPVLARALEPFPIPVRTLDAVHLSTALFLHRHDRSLRIATYEGTLAAAAAALRIRVLQP